jgi:hypothetical protein
MSANAYEQITFEQLTNRAYVEGTCMGITPILADTFYSVQYWVDSKGGWWNAFETVDQTAAENEIATWRKTGGDNRMRIVEVTVPEVVGTIMGSDDEMRIIVIPNENEVVGTRNSTGALDSQYTVTESIRAMTPGATVTDEQII